MVGICHIAVKFVLMESAMPLILRPLMLGEGGAPDRTEQHVDPGSNSTIVRTLAGEELMAAAAEAGYVKIESEITPRDMDRFQPHQVKKKRSVWARFVGMRIANSVVPDVRGLRLKPLARRNSLSVNLNEARGARQRAQRFKSN